MERYLCIHGHFYQPPRENPWLEAIELQDSAHPYHDWNERITAECYAPNSASRILDGDGRVLDIVSNYSRMSFNFGPTLLSWMEANSPDIYSAILEADRISAAWRSGHGNAIAQPYNHMIMPLATARDKRTQVIWGIADFSRRFGRRPEGMWLPETAVDIETLRTLAEQDIRFTVLAPRQASRERKTGTRKWRDVSNSRIDPARPYICRLPGGRSICLFFYDGPISQAVAFEPLLARGEDFAERLISGFSDARTWPQILSIATDGETFGHHQRFGDMALAYALNDIESKGLARLTNFAEYLEKYPPEHEVEIFENSSWSCIHGIERWRDNCGCNSGGRSDWHQRWRKPLREALDWLREQLQFRYENSMRGYLKDPWLARDSYIDIVLDRSPEKVKAFIGLHAVRSFDADETRNILSLLEMQRHAMLMYTSCGWFFDEISSIETMQILKYAARAIQLGEEIFGEGLEKAFEERLAVAESNIREKESGAVIFESFVRPAVIDIARVGVHFAISSVFEDYPEETRIFCYEAHREAHELRETGDIRLLLGRVRVSSVITLAGEVLSYAVIHFGQHALNCGVRIFQGDAPYAEMQEEMLATFEKGNLADIVRLMDKHFGNNNFTLRNLFLDEQRKILTLITSKAVLEMVEAYREIFANNGVLMEYLRDLGMPVPEPYRNAAAAALNHQLLEEFSAGSINAGRVQSVIAAIRKWDVTIQAADTEFHVRKKIEEVMESLARHPDQPGLLVEMQRISELSGLLPLAIDFWHVQNLYFSLARSVYPAELVQASSGDPDAQVWTNTFRQLGEMLHFNVGAVLPGDGSGGEVVVP